MAISTPSSYLAAIKAAIAAVPGVSDVRTYEQVTDGVLVPSVFVRLEGMFTTAPNVIDEYCATVTAQLYVVVPKDAGSEIAAWDLAMAVLQETRQNSWGLAMLGAVIEGATENDTEFPNDLDAIEIRFEQEVSFTSGKTFDAGDWTIRPHSQSYAGKPLDGPTPIGEYTPAHEHTDP